MGRGGISHFVVGMRYPYDYNCSEGCIFITVCSFNMTVSLIMVQRNPCNLILSAKYCPGIDRRTFLMLINVILAIPWQY